MKWQGFINVYHIMNYISRPDDLHLAVKADFDDLGGEAGGSGFETGINCVVNGVFDLFGDVSELLWCRFSGDVGRGGDDRFAKFVGQL